MPRHLKNLDFPTVNVYNTNILEPAAQYNYAAFLMPKSKHDPMLFEILKNRVFVRVIVMRKELSTFYENKDGEEKVYQKTTYPIINNIYGIVDKVIPNPPRDVLEQVVKYSGYNNVDDWVLDFCNSIPHHTALNMTYLCIYKGYGKKCYVRNETRVYLITVAVRNIKKDNKGRLV